MDFERDDLLQERDTLVGSGDGQFNLLNMLIVFTLVLLCLIGVPDVSAAILKQAKAAAAAAQQQAREAEAEADAARDRAEDAENRAKNAEADSEEQREKAQSAEQRAKDAEREAEGASRDADKAKRDADDAKNRAKRAEGAADAAERAKSSAERSAEHHRRRADAAERDVEHLRPRAIHVVLAVDGSASMGHVLERIEQLTRVVGEVASRLATEFKLGVVVYRGVGNHEVFPLTAIGPGAEGKPDPGMTALRRFLTAKTMTLYKGAGGHATSGGERVGMTLGESFQATVLEPVNTPADFEGGISLALGQFEGVPDGGRRLLAVMGDVSFWEMGTGDIDTIEPSERRAADRVEQRIRGFAGNGETGEVLMVFTGRGSWRTNLHSETVASFRRLASAAGQGGRYTDDLAELTGTLVEAVIERADAEGNQ